MGNSVYLDAEGIGTIFVQTKEGTRLIKDVLLVPNLKSNLFEYRPDDGESSKETPAPFMIKKIKTWH